MRVLLIGNRGDGDAGWVGEHLHDAYGADIVRCWRRDVSSWPNLEGVDLVVSLGSDWSVYWDHVRDSVRAEAELVQAAHHQHRPMLAICFGAQVAAQALGGAVESAPEPEIGWFPLEASSQAPFDDGPWFQWHADRFIAPPGATTLATTQRAVQAFAAGRLLAVQFHPEVTELMVERWASGGGVDELERRGVDRERLLEDTGRLAQGRRLSACRLVDSVLHGW